MTCNHLFLFSFRSFLFEILPKWTFAPQDLVCTDFETLTGVYIYAFRNLTIILQSQYAILWLVFFHLCLIWDYQVCYVLCALDCLFKLFLQTTLICMILYYRHLETSRKFVQLVHSQPRLESFIVYFLHSQRSVWNLKAVSIRKCLNACYVSRDCCFF